MKVSVHEHMNVLQVAPVTEGLLQVLTAYRTEREPSVRMVGGVPQRYLKTNRLEFPLYVISDDQKTLFCPAGLLEVIKEHVKLQRQELVYTGDSPVLPPYDPAQLPELRPGQDVVLNAIATNPRGLIKCATAFGKSFLTATICALWRSKKFLVISTTSSVCNGLYKGIQERLPDEQVFRMFGGHSGNKMRKNCRVIVTTTASLHRIPRDWPDVIMFDEVHGAGSPTVSRQLTEFLRCICFGLSATPLDRSDSLNLVIESIFGRIIAEFSFEESRQKKLVAAVHVYAVRCNMPDVVFRTDFEAEMLGYWYNHERNRRLCEAAHRLCPQGPTLHYVAKLEHALILRRSLLPNAPIAYGSLSKERAAEFKQMGLLTDQEAQEILAMDPGKLEDAFRAGKHPEVICTSVWRQGTDFPDLACVVRYDGEGGTISCTQIPGRVARLGSDGQKQVGILVDGADEFGQRFHTRWLKRKKNYKANNWPIMETDP